MRISSNINKVIQQLQRYQKELDVRLNLIIEQLSKEGFEIAKFAFANARYDGDNDTDVFVEWQSETECTIVAQGRAVLFIEFGSGITYGYGHPKPASDNYHYGPGTWSEGPEGKGHWDDPDGWYYGHGKKSWGNPPAMAMYNAGVTMHQRVLQIAKEVFG